MSDNVKVEVEVEVVKLDTLQPDPDNANKGTERGQAMLADSLQERGAARGVFATRDLVLKAGNKTHQAAIDSGFEEAILVHTDGKRLVVTVRDDLESSDPEARRLALEDNRIGQVSLEWDAEELGRLLADDGEILEGLFQEDELAEVLGDLFEPEPTPDPGPQVDKAAELQEKWQVRPGDVFEIGEHRLACGNCTDADVVAQVMRGEKAGAVVTDPPYSSGGLHASARRQKVNAKYKQTESRRNYTDFSGDNRDQRSWIQWCSLWLADFHRISEDEAYLMVFCDWRQIPALTDAVQVGGWIWRGVNVWDKTEGARMAHQGYFRAQAEFVVWATPRQLTPRYDKGGPAFPGVFSCAVDSDKVHLTQKPVEVLSWLLGITVPRCVVLDPFLGSGTTMVACQQLGRRCRGIEIEPKYCAVTLERMSGMNLHPQRVNQWHAEPS